MTGAVRRAGGAAVALVLALGAVACSDDGQRTTPDEPAAASSSGASKASRVETEVTWGKVTGKLPRDARVRLGRQVRGVVEGWERAAYLGGDYPRRHFARAWPGFTKGAQAEARHDRALMSNENIGGRIDGVRPRHSRVRIDALAVKQHPVGVTAHVLLDYGTTGKVRRAVRVQGRLYLTRTKHGWQVFGYDVTKGAR